MSVAAEPSRGGGDRATAWALMGGNFAIGIGIMAVPGALNEIARGLSVPVAGAGQLVTVGGWTMAIAGPVLATLLTGHDRRVLLTLALLWFAAGHALSAAMPTLGTFLPVRAATVVAAVVFTPQAAALMAAVTPPERRGRAIAFVFAGWSLASVLGMPLAAQMADLFGWRTVFVGVASFATAAAVAVWAVGSPGLRVDSVTAASWRLVLRHPLLPAMVGVTALSASGQFTLFSYMAPYYRDVLGAAGSAIALLFFWFGIFGVVGNLLMMRFIDRLGAGSAASLSLGVMLVSLLLWPLAGSASAMALVLVPWALGCFSSNSAQQARLAGTAPALTAVLVALNSSAMYLGQGVGGGLGGALLATSGYALLSWASAALILAALLLSMHLVRRARSLAHG